MIIRPIESKRFGIFQITFSPGNGRNRQGTEINDNHVELAVHRNRFASLRWRGHGEGI